MTTAQSSPLSADRPNEDAVLVFALLMLQFKWEQEELHRCGVEERDFRLFVRKMRSELIEAGLIEENW